MPAKTCTMSLYYYILFVLQYYANAVMLLRKFSECFWRGNVACLNLTLLQRIALLYSLTVPLHR